MLKIDDRTLASLEEQYPGIRESIRKFDAADLPDCAPCGSDRTSRVLTGIIGRTINIAAATTKVKLIANGIGPGGYYCNACERFFG
ncbi:MAG: hypothetical protein SGI77_19535 [Pirellulaceae bacterium]|nr:hypothetical protein [Pirellulaceae bacterium]